jgi:hypothetical protein
MRRVVLMVLTAAAIGVGGSAASAAPADGNAIGNTAMSNVTHVQHWRWGSGGHWRWGSGGHWRWGSGGHWRWGSGGHWRWGSRGRW